MSKRWRAAVGPLLVLFLFVGSLWLLHNELEQYHLQDFLRSLLSIPADRFWLAVALTIANYLILIGYDLLGIRFIRHPMSLRRIALASFIGQSVGNNFGTLLGSSTIRFRLYTVWGFSAFEILRLVLILSVTFWIGLFALAGVVFLIEPLPIPARLHLPLATTWPLGIVLCLLAAAYLAFCAFHRGPVKTAKWDFSPPPVELSILQFAVAALDLLVAACVLYVLLPSSVETSYLHFLSIYLLAITASFLTQVPGGLGVMELVIVVLLSPSEPVIIVGSLLAYRLIYYMTPLVLGLLVLGGNELVLQGKHRRQVTWAPGRWTVVVTPRVLAISVFFTGVVLLFSGAVPAEEGRLQVLQQLVPLPVIEVSHFLGSVAGVLLIILARALQRRIESAHWLTVLVLVAGILLSLLKGFDYEEAAALGVMLVALLPSHGYFYRQGTLQTERFSAGWVVATVLVLAGTGWVMFFAYRQVDYRAELWWQCAVDAHLSRSLRAILGAALTALVFAAARPLRPRQRPPAAPRQDDLIAAGVLLETSPRLSPQLAMLGDQRFLFSRDQRALVMYSVGKRSWVSWGDPIGDEAAAGELAWDFCELCQAGGNCPVFYQVDQERLAPYVEMGLTLIRVGEQARVPLANLGLDGVARSHLLGPYERLHQAGCRLEILTGEFSPNLVEELAKISRNWLAGRGGDEPAASLVQHSAGFPQRSALALVRRGEEVVAYADLRRTARREEVCVDRVRYLLDGPQDILVYLTVELMLWGHEFGYRWLNLGLAPVSGVELPPDGPRWHRIAALAYPHREHFADLQELRAYHQAFAPVWSPKYLASPGGFALPLMLDDITAMISRDA